MANHDSAIKRNRQALKKREANRSTKSDMRSGARKVREAVAAGDLAKAKQLLIEVERKYSKAATKGVIHRGNASRSISRLAKLISNKNKK